jgi:hypothetical protein
VLVDDLGKPLRPELYSDRFRRLCREARLRTIHLHLIRHTLAGLWIVPAWHQWTLPRCWGTPWRSTSARI